MMQYDKHYSLRTEEELLKKLQYVAKYHGRSVNTQINFSIRETIAAFEKEHGEIQIEK